MMREGRLLAEAHPNHLMKELALPTLEDAFLYLCRNENPSGAHTRILTLSNESGSTNADIPDDNDPSLPLLSKANVKVTVEEGLCAFHSPRLKDPRILLLEGSKAPVFSLFLAQRRQRFQRGPGFPKWRNFAALTWKNMRRFGCVTWPILYWCSRCLYPAGSQHMMHPIFHPLYQTELRSFNIPAHLAGVPDCALLSGHWSPANRHAYGCLEYG